MHEGQNHEQDNGSTPSTTESSTGHKGRTWAQLNEHKHLVILSALIVITVWLLVGSIWFPLWWYWAIFTQRSSIWESTSEGFTLLWTDYLVQLGIILGLLSAFIFLVIKFRHALSPIAKSWFWKVSTICFAGILANILILNSTQRPPPFDQGQIQAMLAQSQALLSAVVDRVGNGQAPSQINKPIDFIFIDAKRIEDLHAQIQPTLIEKSRKVSSSSKKHVGAEAKVGQEGVASLGIDSSKEQEGEQTSELEKSGETSSSEAIEVINYCLSNHQVSFYNTEEGWHVAYTIRSNTLNRSQENLGLAPIAKIGEDKDQDDAEKKIIEESNKQLKEELGQITDLVFIDGMFEKHEAGGQDVLIEHFSKGKNKVDFIVEVPRDTFKNFGSGAKVRVFGRVNHPLDGQGKISIQPIAIF